MRLKAINNNSFINFKSRISRNMYSDEYLSGTDYNGKFPDSFLLKRIGESPPEKFILDLGAGQGRNTGPIAQKGHGVFACEINPLGIADIKNISAEKGIADRVKVFSYNILDGFNLPKPVDFAFMSHVSQHLNIKELQTVFKNVAEVLNTGGEFVFDALERRLTYKALQSNEIPVQEELEARGSASFDLKRILDAAKEEGFNFVKSVLFNENSSGRALYETQKFWGGTGEIPVVLKWFVFRK